MTADDLEEIESKFTIRKVVISEQELEKLSLAISQENLSNQERGKRYSTSRTQSQRSHKPTNASAIRPEIDSELDTGGQAIASKLDQTKQLLNEVSVSGEQIEMDQNICSEDNIRPPEESGMKEHESGVPIRTRKERKTREGFGLYQVKKGKFSDKLSNAESNKASTNKDKARKADTLQKRTKNAKRDTEVGEQRHGHEQQQKNDKSSPRQKARPRPSAKFKTDQFHRSSKSEVEFHESPDTGGNLEFQKRKMQGKRLSYSIDDGNVDHSYPEHDNEERTPVRTKYIDDWDFTDSSHLVQLNFDSETNDPLHPESDELFHIKKTNIPFEKLKLDEDFYKLSASGNLSSSSGEASDPIKDCVSGKQREKRQKHTKVSIAGNIEAQESDLSSNTSDELKPDMKPCLEENYSAVNGEDNMRGVNSSARESKAGRGRAQRKPLKDPQSGSDRMYSTEKKRIRRRDIEDIQKFSSHNEKKGSMSTNMSSTHSNNEGLKVANHPKVERNNTKNKDLKRNNSIGQYINESEDWDLDDDVSDLSVELRKDQDSLVISSDGEEQHKSMDTFVDNISESDVIECQEREIEKDPIISDTKTIDKISNSDLQSGMSEAIKDLHNIKGDVDKQSHEIESGKSLEFTQKVAGIIVLPSSAILNESATNKNCESVTFNEVPSSEKFTTAMKLNNDNRNIMANSKVEPANFLNRPITITVERSGNLIPPANVLLETVKDTTHLISNLLSRGLSNTNKIVKALDLSLKIQNAYRELILKHPTIAWKYDAENLLWKQAYHSLISIFRMNLDKKNQLHPVLYRSLTEHYWMFLHNGCKFLEDLLVALQQEHQFDLYELIETPYVRKSVSKQVKLALRSCHLIFLFLGDLERYICDYKKDTDYAKAQLCYEQAQMLAPKNGKSYNQLAVVAVNRKHKLDAVYYYARSLEASNPILSARDRLTSIFEDIKRKVSQLKKKLESREEEKLNWADIAKKPRATNAERYNDSELSKEDMDHIRDETWVFFRNGKYWKLKLGKDGQILELTPSGTVKKEERSDHEVKISLKEINKNVVLHFLHVHSKLYTGIGLENIVSYHEEALQEFKALLKHPRAPSVRQMNLVKYIAINIFAVENSLSKQGKVNIY